MKKTKEEKPKVGRPRGRTSQGEETRKQLYSTALQLIAERGFEAATLRDVAERAGVSVGLLYKYFSSKRAIVLALYDELSIEYVQRAESMTQGPWRSRFLFALRASLEVLKPHRAALYALTPVLVGGDENLFSRVTATSRDRVRAVFIKAVCGASDSSEIENGEALGRVLYVAHLGVLLWWLLDQSPQQRATERLLQSLESAGPLLDVLFGLPFVGAAIDEADLLCSSALLGETR
jgi:AcrR family transcriptional regulator